MTRPEVLEKLCLIATDVRNKIFHSNVAADCICESKANLNLGFEFEDAVLDFIREAVSAKIKEQETLRDFIHTVSMGNTEFDDLESMARKILRGGN